MRIAILLTAIVVFGSFNSSPVYAQTPKAEESQLSLLLRPAMLSSIRSEAEVARDNNRKPLETLEFFGITPSMKVLELIPGGGWYTKLLAPVLRDKGELFVAIGTNGVEKDLLGLDKMDKIKILQADVEITMSATPRLRTMQEFALGEKNFDAVLTFRNMHNFDTAGRNSMNKAAFKALKSGGIYGVVDHTRRHMEPLSQENRRRADPVLTIKEVQAVGFEFVDFSDLHYRADDELRYEVGRKSVAGNTDRFTFLFRKPK